uniref:FAD/NAD(P)-binding domain-containing protein n=1 Tax=Biomphalaria glabrata TaxID=6526 RepID=A0A2C9M5T0_BIOGL
MTTCYLTFLSCLLVWSLTLASVYHDYCIVGGGPSGLQLGYFLKTTSRDYIVFERSNISGSFFELYPRHRKLISLNKRNTGKVNKEFSLRHDWNSLLSDDDDLLFTKYSREIFPHADLLLQYMNDYQRKLNIKVQFNTNIQNIHSVSNHTAPDGHVFTMNDQNGQDYVCRTLIMATGVSTPNIPQISGIDYTIGYESMSVDPENYEGKTVLILGRGNSAFEIADSIYGHTNLIHMMGRSRVRLAWSTHYVGDLRAVNNALLDTYQLKSLDGLFETPLEAITLSKQGQKIHVHTTYFTNEREDNSDLRAGYDVVIRALGFKFDTSPFLNTSITRGKGRAQKFPAIFNNYESKDLKGLFYAGTASHSLDFKKSSGGFIHGFRYTGEIIDKQKSSTCVKTLFVILLYIALVYHGVIPLDVGLRDTRQR